jgi:hypothetical protein
LPIEEARQQHAATPDEEEPMPQRPSNREVPPAARAFSALQAEDALLPGEASALRRSLALVLAGLVLVSVPLYGAANAVGLVGDRPLAIAKQGTTSQPGGDDGASGGSGEGDGDDESDDSLVPEGGAADPAAVDSTDGEDAAAVDGEQGAGALGPGDPVDPANGDPAGAPQDTSADSETDGIEAGVADGVNAANDGQAEVEQEESADSETDEVVVPDGAAGSAGDGEQVGGTPGANGDGGADAAAAAGSDLGGSDPQV